MFRFRRDLPAPPKPTTRMLLGSVWFLAILCVPVFVSASDLRVGFAEFNRTSEDASPAAVGLFSLTNPDGVLVSESGIGATVPINKGRLFVQQTLSVATGLALANPSDSSVTLDLILRNAEGREVGLFKDFIIPPGQHSARFINEFFPEIPSPFTGSLTFQGTDPEERVAALTLRQSLNAQGEPVLTTLPVADLENTAAGPSGSSTDTLVFPQVGSGPGFSTQLVLVSRSPARTTGQVRFTASDGRPLKFRYQGQDQSSFGFEIPALGVILMELLPSGNGSVGVGYASIEVLDGDLPSGSAIFRYTNEGHPVSEAGVRASAPLRRARILVDTRDTATGLALANTNSTSVDLQFRLFDANGSLLKELTRSLPARNHFAQFVSQLFDLPARFVGLLEIESPHLISAVTLKLSQNRRGNSILTTLPMANLSVVDSRPNLIFPQVGTGGSFVGEFLTNLLFIAPLQEHPVVGQLRFWDSSGGPLELELIPGDLTTVIEGGALGEVVFSDRPRPMRVRKGSSVSQVVDASGGTITMDECNGGRITLEIPAFALSSPREIEMTCLSEKPADTLGRNVFPGILLEPKGLFFLHPARLQFLLPDAIEKPGRTSILTGGFDGIPRSVFESEAAGQLLTGEIYHFSSYWGDEVNFHDLLFWTNTLGPAFRDPAYRERALEIFRSRMGFDLDPRVLDRLERLAEIGALLNWERILDSVESDVEKPQLYKDLLEELTLEYLQDPVPADPCGQPHSLGLTLRSFYSLLIGENAALDARIAQMDEQCLGVNLNGFWRSDPQNQSETCWYPNDPYSPWTETERTGSYRFRIRQDGSSFTISIPDYPEAPTLKGSIYSTGGEDETHYFSVDTSGSQSVDCDYFFETDGSFADFDPLCTPDSQFSCRARSCREREWFQGIVSVEGDHLFGRTRWVFAASVLETPRVGCCTLHVSISCQGGGGFSWRRDQ